MGEAPDEVGWIVTILCVLPVTAIAVAALTWKKPTWKRIGVAAAIGVAFGFLGSLFIPVHMCDRGQGLALLPVPWLSAMLVAVACGRRTIALSFAVLMMIAATYIGSLYAGLVHRHGVTGNPTSSSPMASQQLKVVELTLASAKFGIDPDREIPAGWLDESELARESEWLARELTADAREGRWYREDAGTWWHSGFSRLYPVRYVRLGVWYPGGKVADAAHRLEIRDRS